MKETNNKRPASPAGRQETNQSFWKLRFGICLLLAFLYLGTFTVTLAQVANVDLTWSTNTRVPKWYKGKPLAGPSSLITIKAPVANQSNFRWELDDQELYGESGTGKNTLSFVASGIPKITHRINLTIFAPGTDIRENQNITAIGSLLLTVQEPEILFYEVNPLLGELRQQALLNIGARANENIEIIARPFYLSGLTQMLQFQWTINDQQFAESAGNKPDRLFLGAGDIGTSASVSLFIKNIANLFERARASFTLITR